jgi:hypothetical protein
VVSKKLPIGVRIAGGTTTPVPTPVTTGPPVVTVVIARRPVLGFEAALFGLTEAFRCFAGAARRVIGAAGVAGVFRAARGAGFRF